MAMAEDDGHNHLGFMGPILGRARKVLFPDGAGVGSSPSTTSTTTHDAAHDGPATTTTTTGGCRAHQQQHRHAARPSRGGGHRGGEGKSSRRTARRARLAAASNSLSSLANIHRNDAGKENERPTAVATHRTEDEQGGGGGGEKRGVVSSARTSMDSLAGVGDDSAAEQPAAVAADRKKSQPSSTIGSAPDVNARRRSRSSLQHARMSRGGGGGGCSLSSVVCNNGPQQQLQRSRQDDTQQAGVLVTKHAVGETEAHALDLSSLSRSDETTSLGRDAGVDGSTTARRGVAAGGGGAGANRRKNRRAAGRGRRQHVVSSLVQQQEARRAEAGGGCEAQSSRVEDAKAKRTSASGLSSLMSLPSSTHKARQQQPAAELVVGRRKKVAVRRKDRSKSAGAQMGVEAAAKDEASTNDTKGASEGRGGQSSADVNVSSLTIDIDTLRITPRDDDDDQQQPQQMECSTPRTVRNRGAPPGTLASPPGFLHRYSTLSSANDIFGSARSPPTPATNPSLKKRFDAKETPDAMVALHSRGGSSNRMEESPATRTAEEAATWTMSPRASCRVGSARKSPGMGGGSSPFVGVSPRVLITSSSFVASSPIDEGGELSSEPPNDDARSNLFPSTPAAADGERIERSEEPPPPNRRLGRGTAVLEVEEATPRVAVLSGRQREGEPTAAPTARTTGASDQTASRKANASRKKKPAQEKAGSRKGDGATRMPCIDKNGIEPRRSSRQTIPTDRLTVTTWEVKEKREERKVRFDDAATAAEEEEDGDACDENDNPEPSIACEKPSKDESCNDQTASASSTHDAETACATNDGSWSKEELTLLRSAQRQIDPMSEMYWQEVADQVGTRSSSECQIMWQSMVATPKARKAKKAGVNKACEKPKAMSGNGVLDSNHSDTDEEDDLFNSSPYRDAELHNEGDLIVTKFSNFGVSSGLSPRAPPTNLPEEEASALKFRRKGYNTYIENLRKDIHRVEKKKRANKHSDHPSGSCVDENNICAESGNGENQISGKLLSDGTVKIDINESSDVEDDIWGDEEED